MKKNEDTARYPALQCIRVADESGNIVGTTYPKRARGLVKHGRAFWMNDSEICLKCPPEITEDITMNNTIDTNTQNHPVLLDFSARDFQFNPDCNNNRGNRTFITAPFDDAFVEVWQLGNWQWDWSEIMTKELTLARNTKHLFRFWLKGGENDQWNETCQFKVIFDNDTENELVFMLNRDYIKPKKQTASWQLYELPFVTGDHEHTTLKFAVMRAVTMLMPVYQTDEEIAVLPDDTTEQQPAQGSSGGQNESGFHNHAPVFNFNGDFHSSADVKDFAEQIRSSVMENLNLDDIMEEVTDMVDPNQIAEQIRQSIQNSFSQGESKE